MFSTITLVFFVTLAQFVASQGVSIPLQIKSGNSARGHLGKRQSEPLKEGVDGALWIAEIAIGSPPQKIELGVSTDDSFSWLPSTSCNEADICGSLNKYNPQLSSMKQPLNQSVIIQQVGDLFLNGSTYLDKATIGGITAKRFFFAAIDSVSPGFPFYPVPTDGVLSLALQPFDNRDTFVQAAYKQKLIPANEFSIFLADKGSELYLGGKNPSLYEGKFETHNINATSGKWQIPHGAVSVNGKRVFTDTPTIISTISTLITASPATVKALFDKIPGTVASTEEGITGYTYDCKNPPKISFSWGGRDFPITPENIQFGDPDTTDPTKCTSTIVAFDSDVDVVGWTVGIPFLKSYYTTFSYEKKSIAFTNSKCKK